MQDQCHSTASKTNPSWWADLDAYISSHTGLDGDGSSSRQGLVAAVKATPQSAEAWTALLAHEELHSSNVTQQQPGAADPARVSLYHLYFYATQLVPRNKNQQKEAYLRLWLGLAKQQWARSQDDARDTFKTLKNQHIGDASAYLYYEWAVLEHSAGNISKALGIIAKGMRAEAQPMHILQQLQGELQSGTFDLKAAAAVTETLTLDAGALAPQQVDSTPAHSSGYGLRAAPGTTSAASVSRGPAAAATAAGPGGINSLRSSSFASCLKAPTAVGAAGGLSEHHAARAVTFAADVHDAQPELAPHGHQHRAGSLSVGSSHRSTAHNVDGHSGCLSNASSTPSRSTASVHDGTMPFSSGAVSYKSSTTEGSTMDGSEEATISYGAGAAGPAGGTSSKSSALSKPSTAPLSGASSTTPAAGGNANTATLGLKRFGFKSRALRVGGSADTPAVVHAAANDPVTSTHYQEAAAEPAPAVEPAAGAAGTIDSNDHTAAGRKRRAAANSTPSPNVSPKLAAAVRHGQQCKVQPGEDTAGAGPAPIACSQTHSNTAGPCVQRSCAANAHAGTTPQGDRQDRQAVGSSGSDAEDETVPLVGSQLAARVSQERGTPLAAGRARDAVAQGLGLWTSPLDGQLPSSLETTPSDVLPAATQVTATASAAGADGHRVSSRSSQATHTAPRDRQPRHDCGEQPGSRQTVSSRQPLAAVPTCAVAVQGTSSEEAPPAAPTLVLPDVPAVACRDAAAKGVPAAHEGSSQPQASSNNGSGVTVQQHRQPAAAREPLRPLQTVQPTPAGPQLSAAGSKAQPAGQTEKPVTGTTHAAKSDGGLGAEQPHVQQMEQPDRLQAPQQQPSQQLRQQQQQQQAQLAAQQAQQRQQQQQQQPPAVRQTRPKEDPQTVFVQGVRYHKLECVGRGGSSKVFKVMGPGCKIYALKRIKLAGRDEEAASGFIDEINLLNTLKDKPNIIQLVDSQVFTAEGLIYMVQEYGEIDLARLLAKHATARKEAGNVDNIDENFIRLYWQQMLQAVAGVHEQRIVHSDLKPANFLLVEGQLKLIDFGIAKAICGDTTSIARESQVGTLNYMSPEAILGGSNNILGGPAMKVGRPSDVWSLGCILYQMVYGRTPFADLPFGPKMHAICNPQYRVPYPELANKYLLDVMQRCLDRDPKSRITLQELLDHPFLHPNRVAAAPAAVPVLSEEQMKLLVAQVQAAGAAGLTDLDKLTRELMQKLGATSIRSSSSASISSGCSTPDASAGLQPSATLLTATALTNQQQQPQPRMQQQQQQTGMGNRQGTGGLPSGSSSSRSRMPTAPPAAQPGWR